MAASRDGKRVKGLILVSGYYFPTWRFDVWFASVAAIPLIGDALRHTISPISGWLGLQLFAKKTFAPRPEPDIVRKEYAAHAGPPESTARGCLGLGIPAAVSGNAHDVIPPPQVPHRDHRRT
jgi:hypothetical protein